MAIVRLRPSRIEDVPVAELSGLAIGGSGSDRDRGQLEAVAVANDGTILVLSENPPLVRTIDSNGDGKQSVELVPGDRGDLADVFDESSSGEGLLVLGDGRLLIPAAPHRVRFGNLCWYRP
jgi:hypothetical protein